MTSRRPKDQRRLKVATELPKEAPKRPNYVQILGEQMV